MSGVNLAGARRFSTCSLEKIHDDLLGHLHLRCLSGTKDQDGSLVLSTSQGDIKVQ
jgi:hypothetical protein